MYHSQFGQDKFLEETIFKGYKNGVYMDIGAHDGITHNNTLYFEQRNGWTGINIEPIKEVYDKLVANRPRANNINCAVCNCDGTTEFLCCSGYTEMLSGIKQTYDSRHATRLESENKRLNGKTVTITVLTKRIETILNESGVNHINYLSIDVEGAEFEVIKSINFSTVFIDIIGFENNYYDKSLPIINYLKSHGFKVILTGTDIIMINLQSQFYKRDLFVYN